MSAGRGTGNPFLSYSEAINWLYGTQLFGIKFGLDNIRRLLTALGLPDAKARVVHVAGTNGKGSVCAMVDSILHTTGLRTGLFTSPHLVTYCERMRINGGCIPEAEAATRLERIRDTVARWDPHPTFFELTLALALDWFRDDGAEVIVLETGMGGRLDATNAVPPRVSVITPIALDHQKWLGDSLEEIAAEKAGILKPGVSAVSADQSPEIATILRETAERIGAPLSFVDEIQIAALAKVAVGMEGHHQRENAALAVAAVRALGIAPDEETLCHALAAVRWRGRFERFCDSLIIVDGAHNPQAARALVATWKSAFGEQKAQLVFGAVEGKDCSAMLALLAPITVEITYVRVQSQRGLDPADLAAEHHPDPAIPKHVAASLEEALAIKAGSRILVSGSLFLAGEAIALLDQSFGFEQSAQ